MATANSLYCEVVDELMRCWWCGVEPTEVLNVYGMQSTSPVRQIPCWPAGGDHSHNAEPPTADEMAAQAYALNTRIGAGL